MKARFFRMHGRSYADLYCMDGLLMVRGYSIYRCDFPEFVLTDYRNNLWNTI